MTLWRIQEGKHTLTDTARRTREANQLRSRTSTPLSSPQDQDQDQPHASRRLAPDNLWQPKRKPIGNRGRIGSGLGRKTESVEGWGGNLLGSAGGLDRRCTPGPHRKVHRQGPRADLSQVTNNKVFRFSSGPETPGASLLEGKPAFCSLIFETKHAQKYTKMNENERKWTNVDHIRSCSSTFVHVRYTPTGNA